MASTMLPQAKRRLPAALRKSYYLEEHQEKQAVKGRGGLYAECRFLSISPAAPSHHVSLAGDIDYNNRTKI
jgi:hypothetical protein